MKSIVWISMAVLLAADAGAATPTPGPAGGFRPLFDGKGLDGWTTFLAKPEREWNVPGLARDAEGNYTEAVGVGRDPLGVFKVETVDGRPAIHISGQGFGVLTTKESFENYHLRLQVKWGEARWGKRANLVRDSGLLYHVHGPDGFVDGAWPGSQELQIQEHDFGDLYTVGTRITVRARRGEGEKGRYVYDPTAEPVTFQGKTPTGSRCVKSEDKEKARGEWNTVELIAFGDDALYIVNGAVVMRLTDSRRLDGAEAAPLAAGRVSVQSEGAEVFYRDIEVRPITEIPAEFREAPAPRPRP